MAELTLTDVVDRLKREGDLTRNSGTNSLKSLKDIIAVGNNTIGQQLKDNNFVGGLMLGRLDELVDIFSGNALAALEKEKENSARLDAQQKALDEIADNTEKKPEVKKMGEDEGGAGFMLAGLAAIAGLSAGALAGWMQAVKAATSPIARFGMTVLRFIGRTTGITKSIGALSTILDDIIKALKGTPARIMTTIDDVMLGIKAAFSGAAKGDGFVARLIRNITGYIDDVVKAFDSALDRFKTVTSAANRLSTRVSGIWAKVSSIASKFKVLSGVFSAFKFAAQKIFYPLSLIIASIEAVTASWDSFAEGDILEGLEILVTEFFDSLIVAPFDMVKDAIAWILDKMGFDETSEVLKEFSFSDLWRQLTGAIFDGIESAFNWITTLFTNPLQALEELWDFYVGAYATIGDFLISIIEMPINWIMDAFGWSDDDTPDFDLVQYMTDILTSVWDSITGLFDPILNFDWGSLVPDWLKNMMGGDEETPSGDTQGGTVDPRFEERSWWDRNMGSSSAADIEYDRIFDAIESGSIDQDLGNRMLEELQTMADAATEDEVAARMAMINTGAGGGGTNVQVQGGSSQVITIGQTALPDRLGGALDMSGANVAFR